ncbi:hypothetical protein ABZ787_12110 [Micrococcus luteus]|uniref:hypothetical protein n=1 Tax=Micrococcus luteus TaxID=1270 RepID=UPI0033ED0163
MGFADAYRGNFFFSGDIDNGFGNGITFYFNYFCTQFGSQFKMVNQMALLIQFNAFHAFTIALHIQHHPWRPVIGSQSGCFPDHYSCGFGIGRNTGQKTFRPELN